ncbi:RDD family protein [Kitasatospora sp. NPDC088160]|uniref:RDD family protein n=1 Tax=Kitasatospora sp. NPDC088160 TaxID=3364072 RepID=UPI0037F9F899
MTDRPFAGAGDSAVGPEPGYYPDPSIPGFVRYWGGSAWVPGTSRLAPAEGEVLDPPRFASRRPAAGAAGTARAVPPPAVPEAAVPEAASPEPSWGGTAHGGGGGGDTGPVYFDQTAGGAKFVLGSRVAEVIGGPVFRTVGEPEASENPEVSGMAGVPGMAGASGPEMAAVEVPVFGEAVLGEAVLGEPVVEVSAVGGAAGQGDVEELGWQVVPQAQRGLMETGGEPHRVSWGVLSGAPDGEEGRVREVRASVAVPAGASAGRPAAASVGVEVAAASGAPATVPAAVAVREAPSPVASPVAASVPAAVRGAGRAVESASESASEPAVPAPAPAAAGAVPVRAQGRPPAPAAPAGSLPVVRPAREAVARRRPAPAAPAPTVPASVTPAGLGRRLAARAVDTVVLLVVAVAAGIPLGRSASEHLQQKLDQARMASSLTRRQVQVWLVDDVVLGKVAVLLGILLFVSLLYEVLPTARTGQTFGKRLARIRVADAAAPGARARLSLGRSLLRWAVRQLGLLLLVGLVWPVFDRPARRGWQDRAARTRVVRD